jgi:hypothetical protein
VRQRTDFGFDFDGFFLALGVFHGQGQRHALRLP